MQIIKSTDLHPTQKHQVFAIWNQEYPRFLNYARFEDFDFYLKRLQNARHYLSLSDHETIQAWAFDFDRNDERWFGLLVKGDAQGKGLGSALLQELKQNNAILNGWMIDRSTYEKADGSLYKSPANFYKQHHFVFYPEQHMGLELLSAIKIMWTQK